MNSKRIFPLLPALFIVLASPSRTQSIPDAQQWLTTVDGSALFARQAEPLRFSGAKDVKDAKDELPVIVVNDMQRYQTMEGFGFALTGGSAELLMKMTPARRSELLKRLFTTEGDAIGVSYLRVSIGSSDMNDHAYTYDDMPSGQTDPKLEKFSLAEDESTVIPVLKEILALEPEIKILGSPWSAPAWMKTNDALKDGNLKHEFYGAYANYLVKYIESMKAEGIAIHAITVENEPLNPKNTPSLVVFAPEEDELIAKFLGPAFEQAGIKTEIQIYDHNPDVISYPLSILADPEASKYVAGTAFHLYGGESSALTCVHNDYPNKNLYLTEQSVGGRPSEGTMSIAEPASSVLIGATRNWARNVLLWNLAADPHAGPHTNDGGCTGCYGAITLEGDKERLNVAYYALAHFSKFVRPGSVRIGSNELEQLSTAAFLTPEGKVILVAVNTGNFPKTFHIEYHGHTATTTLHSESAATYVW